MMQLLNTTINIIITKTDPKPCKKPLYIMEFANVRIVETDSKNLLWIHCCTYLSCLKYWGETVFTCVKRPLKNRQNKGLNDNW